MSVVSHRALSMFVHGLHGHAREVTISHGSALRIFVHDAAPIKRMKGNQMKHRPRRQPTDALTAYEATGLAGDYLELVWNWDTYKTLLGWQLINVSSISL